MKDSIVELLLAKDFSPIVQTSLKVVENKIRERIEAKKDEVKNKINGKD
jgi:hypothetical protein